MNTFPSHSTERSVKVNMESPVFESCFRMRSASIGAFFASSAGWDSSQAVFPASSDTEKYPAFPTAIYAFPVTGIFFSVFT